MAQYIPHELYLFAEILILDYFILAVKLDKLCHFHVWQPLQILIDNGGVIFEKTAIPNEISFKSHCKKAYYIKFRMKRFPN